jgi:uncharacterized repeat protein (TIGR01451 family)
MAGHQPAAGTVIADSNSAPPGLPPEQRLPAPDDGLKNATPPAAPGLGQPAPAVGVPKALPDHPPDVMPSRKDSAVIPASAQQPRREERPRVPQESMLSLVMEGPAEVAPGQVLSFQVIARNLGTAVLAGVLVFLRLPATARLVAHEPAGERRGNMLSWNLGNLKPGAEQRVRVDLATGDSGELHLCPIGRFTVAAGLWTRVVRPPFELSVTGPESAALGSRVVWKIEIANHGGELLRHVDLTCRLSAGLTHSQGNNMQTELPNGLAPGQVYTVELPVLANKRGRQDISLSASADGGRTAQAQGIVKVEELALGLALQGPRQGRAGEELSYHLEVINPGASDSGPIRLTQALPEGLEFLSASAGGTYNPTTQMITWALSGLPGQQRRETAFQVRAKKGGDWALTAAVAADGSREARSTCAVHVSAPPVLTLDASSMEEPLPIGSDTTLVVRVWNQGTTLARGVRPHIVLPDCLLAVQADAPTRWQIQGQQVLFEPIDQMKPHVSAIYRIRVRGVRAGAGRLRVELTAEELGKAIEQERTCRVQTLPVGAPR